MNIFTTIGAKFKVMTPSLDKTPVVKRIKKIHVTYDLYVLPIILLVMYPEFILYYIYMYLNSIFSYYESPRPRISLVVNLFLKHAFL